MKKKVFKLLFLLISFIVCSNVYYAATGVSLYSSAGSITNGSRVTFSVTVSNAAVFTVTGSSSGATSGCSINEKVMGTTNVTRTFTTTCTATQVGQIGFTVNVNYTDQDYNTSSESKSVYVNVVKPRDPDSNNYLSNLSVEGYEINPKFDKEQLEYSVVVPSTVDEVKIDATKASVYASLSGTGKVKLEEEINEFEIKVVSETEIARIYKVTVTVEDIDPINVTVDNKKYTVIKNIKYLTAPENYSEVTVKMGEFEIPAFYNAKTGFTLVGLKDSMGKVSLFVYDDGKYSQYYQVINEQIAVDVLDIPKALKGYILKDIIINDHKVKALVVKDNSNYAIIYGMNVKTGEKAYYTYDIKNNTLSKYDDELIKLLQNKNQMLSYIMLGACALTIIFFIATISLIGKNSKKKKLIKMYEELEQSHKQKEEKSVKKSRKAKQEKIEEPVLEEQNETLKEEVKKEEVKETTEVYDLFADDKKKKKSKK